MKGDFSKWQFNSNFNYRGVLHQQGRVLLDSDWNDEVQINQDWQITNGQDVIGANVVAVPQADHDGFLIELAIKQADNKSALLQLGAGHAWVDGILVERENANEGERLATYYTDPPTTIGNGVRDAVIMEVWQEAISAFQMEDFTADLDKHLLEPALGGPDTTERLYTATAFKLLRLEAGDNCSNLHDKLEAIGSTGTLTVTLKPESSGGEDPCPLAASGGYSGFEHNFYRIEMARVNAAKPGAFKWSQFNGGLVGRGNFALEGENGNSISLTANLAAIKATRLTEFYVEVVAYDELLGNWQVAYGAVMTLDDDKLTVSDPNLKWFTEGDTPAADENVFIRLWNGIRAITEFQPPAAGADPVMLNDGIRLEFQSANKSDYQPNDYWNFAVRANNLPQPQKLPYQQKPYGIAYHRAPLGILNWKADGDVTYAAHEIDDCRRRFRPLTNQKICCTYTIGDGSTSHGDFDSFDEALTHMPDDGGQLCFLPGTHTINATIKNRHKLRITGCGAKTVLLSGITNNQIQSGPLLTLINCQDIQIDDLTFVHLAGTAIQIKTEENGNVVGGTAHALAAFFIRIMHNRIAATKMGIEVLNDKTSNIQIADNHIAIFDKADGSVGIFIQAMDSRVENNQIVVVPKPESENTYEPNDPSYRYIFDECGDLVAVSTVPGNVGIIVEYVFNYYLSVPQRDNQTEFKALGGIQIGSSSECITVRNNQIWGGRGNGITLGNLPAGLEYRGYGINSISKSEHDTLTAFLEDSLYEIVLEGNDIRFMGLNGIGVRAFFKRALYPFLYSVSDCSILNNTIQKCARQLPLDAIADMRNELAFGGIVLGYGENVIIRENRIEENGKTHLHPLCGIWIMQAEKTEICDNRIVNNGPLTDDTNKDFQPGWRGGIVILANLQKVLTNLVAQIIGAKDKKLEAPQDGIPAAKIHDNTVVQPIGQALLLFALGPVSVANNHFTSTGIVEQSPYSLLGATVLLFNLGISKDIFPYVMLTSMRQLLQQRLNGRNALQRKLSNRSEAYAKLANNEKATNTMGVQNNAITVVPQLYKRFLYWPGGQVLFNDNRVSLDLRSATVDIGVASQTIISLDDISYNGNQADVTSLIDLVFLDVLLTAFTVRTTNNRFQEGMTALMWQAGYSLMSIGLLNTTMNNQSTNCLVTVGDPLYTFTFANAVINFSRCKAMALRMARFFRVQKRVQKSDENGNFSREMFTNKQLTL